MVQYRGFRQRGGGSAALRRRFYYPHGLRRPVHHELPPNARQIRETAVWFSPTALAIDLVDQ
jgi:hypothetical protein